MRPIPPRPSSAKTRSPGGVGIPSWRASASGTPWAPPAGIRSMMYTGWGLPSISFAIAWGHYHDNDQGKRRDVDISFFGPRIPASGTLLFIQDYQKPRDAMTCGVKSGPEDKG